MERAANVFLGQWVTLHPWDQGVPATERRKSKLQINAFDMLRRWDWQFALLSAGLLCSLIANQIFFVLAVQGPLAAPVFGLTSSVLSLPFIAVLWWWNVANKAPKRSGTRAHDDDDDDDESDGGCDKDAVPLLLAHGSTNADDGGGAIAVAATDDDGGGDDDTKTKGWCGISPRRHRFIVMLAFLSFVNNALLITGGSRTAGAVQSLLFQLTIPFVMILSKLLLGTREPWRKVLGGAVVVGGVVVVLSPQFSGSATAKADGGTGISNNELGANAQYALGVLLGACSSVLSTRPLKTWRLPIWTLALLTQLYQLPLALVATPFVYALPGLGHARVPLHEAGAVYRAGLRCVAGLGQGCRGAGLCTLGAVATSTGTAVFAYALIREYSATTVAVVSALSLPATALVFTLPQLGGGTNKPDWQLFVGIALVLAGNVLYKCPAVARGRT